MADDECVAILGAILGIIVFIAFISLLISLVVLIYFVYLFLLSYLFTWIGPVVFLGIVPFVTILAYRSGLMPFPQRIAAKKWLKIIAAPFYGLLYTSIFYIWLLLFLGGIELFFAASRTIPYYALIPTLLPLPMAVYVIHRATKLVRHDCVRDATILIIIFHLLAPFIYFIVWQYGCKWEWLGFLCGKKPLLELEVPAAAIVAALSGLLLTYFLAALLYPIWLFETSPPSNSTLKKSFCCGILIDIVAVVTAVLLVKISPFLLKLLLHLYYGHLFLLCQLFTLNGLAAFLSVFPIVTVLAYKWALLPFPQRIVAKRWLRIIVAPFYGLLYTAVFYLWLLLFAVASELFFMSSRTIHFYALLPMILPLPVAAYVIRRTWKVFTNFFVLALTIFTSIFHGLAPFVYLLVWEYGCKVHHLGSVCDKTPLLDLNNVGAVFVSILSGLLLAYYLAVLLYPIWLFETRLCTIRPPIHKSIHYVPPKIRSPCFGVFMAPQIRRIIYSSGEFNVFHEDSFEQPAGAEDYFLGGNYQGNVYAHSQKVISEHLAVKILSRQIGKRAKQIELEMALLQHPNIVRCYGFLFNKDRTEVLGYVMHFIEFSLEHIISREEHEYSLSQAFSWLGQIASALQFIHKQNDPHPRSVKTCNIRIAYDGNSGCFGSAYLCDFGISKIVSKCSPLCSCGSMLYRAPEVFIEPSKFVYNEAVDVYSLGIVFWELVHKKLVYSLLDGQKEVAKRVLERSYADRNGPPITVDCSEEIKDLLLCCLKRDPKRRPSMEDLKREFGRLERLNLTK